MNQRKTNFTQLDGGYDHYLNPVTKLSANIIACS